MGKSLSTLVNPNFPGENFRRFGRRNKISPSLSVAAAVEPQIVQDDEADKNLKEIDELQAKIIAFQAERRRLHSVKLQLEEMKSNNSNDAAIVVDSTSICSSSLFELFIDALMVAMGVEPQSVHDDVSDNNLIPGTQVTQDLLGSLIGEVEVGREFDISISDDVDKEEPDEQVDEESQDDEESRDQVVKST